MLVNRLLDSETQIQNLEIQKKQFARDRKFKEAAQI